jgi:glycosyltransferase involved in cell wall biosynthesis
MINLSVLLVNYNGAKYLEKSIESILDQTYKKFELIIIDDGSKDDSWRIINRYKSLDKRIRMFAGKHIGLTKNLSSGVKLAKGRYLARQDSDDYSYPERLEKQLNWITSGNKKKVLCGTFANKINDNDDFLKLIKLYQNDSDIKKIIKYKNCFIHSSIFLDLQELKNSGSYDPYFKYSQDYEAWCRLSFCGEVCNLPEPLIALRNRKSSISQIYSEEQEFYKILASVKNFYFLDKSLIKKIKKNSIRKNIEYLSKYQFTKSHVNLMLFLAKHKINWKYKIKYLDCKNYFINFIKQHPKIFIYSLIKNLIK